VTPAPTPSASTPPMTLAARACAKAPIGFGGDLETAAFDGQSLAVHQGLGDLFVSRFEDSSEGLARNVHLFGRLLLV